MTAKEKAQQKQLSIIRCPHGIYGISIDEDGGGHRVTSSKCCGQWTTLRSWTLTGAMILDITNKLGKGVIR